MRNIKKSLTKQDKLEKELALLKEQILNQNNIILKYSKLISDIKNNNDSDFIKNEINNNNNLKNFDNIINNFILNFDNKISILINENKKVFLEIKKEINELKINKIIKDNNLKETINKKQTNKPYNNIFYENQNDYNNFNSNFLKNEINNDSLLNNNPNNDFYSSIKEDLKKEISKEIYKELYQINLYSNYKNNYLNNNNYQNFEKEQSNSLKDRLNFEFSKKLRRNKREIIKQKIIDLASQKKISLPELKEEIVDFNNYCSKATFYRYYHELNDENIILPSKDSKKKYLQVQSILEKYENK